ncbi:MAG TPA: DUF3108 domain-containing protein [Lysobacter sp.]|nr:DUF3108 domain-containing protein [Lysobacter sp.]
MTDHRIAIRFLPLLFAAAGTASAAAPAMKPYAADYQASYMGLHGTGHMSLSQQGGKWVYSLRIGSAVAQLSQSTTFDVNGDALRPLSGTDSSTFLVKRVSKQASYDWKAGQASWSGDVKPERAGPIALQAGDVDAMLLNLALPRDVAAGRSLHYRMVDDGRAKPVNCSAGGKEALDAGGKSLDATKVSCDLGGGKQILLWVVDGMPFPARILQRKNGKDDIDLRLGKSA